MLGLKPGVPCKLRRLDASEEKEGYTWDGMEVHYPGGGRVPWLSVVTLEWEVVKEPTVEEYVKSRGFNQTTLGSIGHSGLAVHSAKPFTLVTAKIACDALEALK